MSFIPIRYVAKKDFDRLNDRVDLLQKENQILKSRFSALETMFKDIIFSSMVKMPSIGNNSVKDKDKAK